MNHCVSCGRKISTGRTAHASYNTHCLICTTKRIMRGWMYKSAAARLRAKAKELEEGR